MRKRNCPFDLSNRYMTYPDSLSYDASYHMSYDPAVNSTKVIIRYINSVFDRN